MSTRSTNIGEGLVSDLASGHPISGASASQSGDLHWNDSDFEKHFKDQGKIQFLFFKKCPIPTNPGMMKIVKNVDCCPAVENNRARAR